MNLPIQAEKVLPHRGKMLLIDTVVSAEEGIGTVLADLSSKSISKTSEGKILAPFYIELVAQTYAAVCGYTFLRQGLTIPDGYLVGVQRFEIHQNKDISESQELIISVQTIGDFDGFAVVEGIVSRDDEIVAEGKIKVFVPQDALPETAASQPVKTEQTIQ